jgi:hypothetical protein
MNDETEPRRPLVDRLGDHVRNAGQGSEFWLRDIVAGTNREPEQLSLEERLNLLGRLLDALFAFVKEIATDVDTLYDS